MVGALDTLFVSCRAQTPAMHYHNVAALSTPAPLRCADLPLIVNVHVSRAHRARLQGLNFRQRKVAQAIARVPNTEHRHGATNARSGQGNQTFYLARLQAFHHLTPLRLGLGPQVAAIGRAPDITHETGTCLATTRCGTSRGLVRVPHTPGSGGRLDLGALVRRVKLPVAAADVSHQSALVPLAAWE